MMYLYILFLVKVSCCVFNFLFLLNFKIIILYIIFIITSVVSIIRDIL